MTAIVAQLFPVFAGLVVGYVLYLQGVAGRADGDFLFKVCYYVCTPALSFSTLATVQITKHLLVFPLAAFGIFTALYVAGWVAGKRFGLSGVRRPTFLLACMIINSGFVLPFAQAIYGDEGVARIVMFQLVNQFLTFGVGYAVAAHSNPNHHGSLGLAKKVLFSPPLFGVISGLLVNACGWTVPSALMNGANLFGGATVFVLTIATGILFNPTRNDFFLTVKVIVIRLICGLMVGALVIVGFDLSGIDRVLVLMLSLSPVAFNAVTFASMEELDAPFAAGALSISLLFSLVLTITVAVLFA